ncbi:MAG: nitroreductase family protein [Lachnospiraceae bacterium]|nr:nitroreductase family protein [Lachnospiraceae bacterium]
MKAIENRRSIRKYKSDEVDTAIIEELIYSATLAPSAKNRQPWKFIVYRGNAKQELVEVMRKGVTEEKITHRSMPQWAWAIPDAENTIRIMEEAPCLIAVLNTNQKTPFATIGNEDRIVEICDSLSIGAAIENLILRATDMGLGTLWIANTCFAYEELVKYIGTEHQLTGIVAVGYPAEAPGKRPRKKMEDILEYREL